MPIRPEDEGHDLPAHRKLDFDFPNVLQPATRTK
jgi:hypothetical protein